MNQSRPHASVGRSIPNFFIRNWSVLRLIPSRVEPSLGTVDIVLNRPSADADGSNNGPINFDRKAPSVGRDPCKLWDSNQQRRIGLDVREKILRRQPEQRRIRLVLRNLYRENGRPIHPRKCFEVPTVVKNGHIFWHTDGSRLHQNRFDHPLCQLR
jgi:hypothetical protein